MFFLQQRPLDYAKKMITSNQLVLETKTGYCRKLRSEHEEIDCCSWHTQISRRSTEPVMGLPNTASLMPHLQALALILLCFCAEFCTCIDTITATQFIKDPQTLVSNGNSFKLGFFSPVNTTNRFVGIMYNVPVLTVIWVANRDRPLNDSSGIVTISEDGNLVVLNGQNEIIWSSNVTISSANSSAQLLHTGNLVLLGNSSERIPWQSFEHPSDSFLQRMELSADVKTGEKHQLTSWKSPSDPSIGSFSAGIDPLNIPQVFVWNGSVKHWRSGPWNGQIFIGIPRMGSVYNNGFNIVNDKQGSAYITFTYANASNVTYFGLNSDGILMQKYWIARNQDWEVFWSVPKIECDVYGKCGAFGSCNSQNSPICTCLRGFEPKQMEEWSRGNWSSGCQRRTQLQCDRNISNNGNGNGEDGFLKLTTMKVPDFAVWSNAPQEDCERHCLNNCSCIAYAYYTGIGCMEWSQSLIDLQKFTAGSGLDLYIRVAYSELDKQRNMTVVIAITLLIGSITIAICTYFSWKWIAKKRGKKRRSELSFVKREAYSKYSNEMSENNMNKVKLEELPLFDFVMLENATEKFHSANKLGEGGFGPVYKGKFPDGQEIAVKRLSRSSGQGLEEFMNEVVVISKLQHRNLVRLLGCCVEGEEKMLIYEYMPNKGLDALLFDPLKQEQLDWSTRVNIIEGIGRGLLYLHRDSRLRIIHRDLKASNILLDEELNAKISDFGMARIFGGKQDQANTTRVVGTYGYMAPEYAMEGRFSEKSDVFSFGVLLLEIVCGRRNTSFYHDEHALNLLGFAWKLWNEDKIAEFIDPRISDPCFKMEILRYIHVGLLCVQDFTEDRPIVATILSMLCSEIADLPTPKQPAFTERLTYSRTDFNKQSQEICSINNVTLTVVEGR